MSLSVNGLRLMKQTDINQIDKETLVDIKKIDVDTTKIVSERIEEFVNKVKNPYCFRVGDIAVKVEFSDTDVTFEQLFEKIMTNQ